MFAACCFCGPYMLYLSLANFFLIHTWKRQQNLVFTLRTFLFFHSFYTTSNQFFSLHHVLLDISSVTPSILYIFFIRFFFPYFILLYVTLYFVYHTILTLHSFIHFIILETKDFFFGLILTLHHILLYLSLITPSLLYIHFLNSFYNSWNKFLLLLFSLFIICYLIFRVSHLPPHVACKAPPVARPTSCSTLWAHHVQGVRGSATCWRWLTGSRSSGGRSGNILSWAENLSLFVFVSIVSAVLLLLLMWLLRVMLLFLVATFQCYYCCCYCW